MMKTLMIITPHMSTGGCPQVVAKKVELLKNFYNVVVVEYEMLAWSYVVQRNRVIEMIGDKFISLSENKEYDLFNIIDDYKPDYIFMEEFPETFMENHITKRLYSKDRTYKIFETTHSSHSRVEWKKYMPDKFIFVSPFSVDTFKDIGVPIDLIEYPIDIKTPNKKWAQEQLMLDPEWKHIINIGLFTSGKNQGYLFEVARLLKDYKIMFHFVGNRAVNFESYWSPIMQNKPDNCVVWDERNDVDTFIQACDVHFFSSIMELNPLSIKESLEYSKPTMIFDLSTYMGKYNGVENVHFLTGDLKKDSESLLSIMGIEPKVKNKLNAKLVHILLDPNEPKDIPLESWKSTVNKQLQSRNCWANIKHKFTNYVPRFNVLNREELPADNCLDPDIINPSKDLIHEPPVLSYGHYGCYKSNRDAIIEEFDDDMDLMILIGGDVVTDLSPDEFYDKVMEAYELGIAHNADMINLNEPVYLSGGEWWNDSINMGNWVKVPHFMVGDVILIFRSFRDRLINDLKTRGWHSFDLWMAWTYSNKAVQFTANKNLAYQVEGYSVLDYQEKDGWET
jgi:hypothetical protein